MSTAYLAGQQYALKLAGLGDYLDTAQRMVGLKKDEPSLAQRLAPVGAGLGTAAGLYALLRHQRLSADPVLRAIQERSGGRLTSLNWGKLPKDLLEPADYALSQKPEWYRRLRLRLARGVDDAVWHDTTRAQMAAFDDLAERIQQTGRTPKKIPGVTPQKLRGAVISHDEPILNQLYQGDVNLTGNLSDILRYGENKIPEARLFQRHAPGLMPKLHGTADKYLPRGRSAAKRLAAMEQKLRAAHPEGYIIKPVSGEASGTVLTNEHSLSEILAGKGKSKHKAWVQGLLEDPSQFMVQERLNINQERRIPFVARHNYPGKTHMPVEYRVHTVDGRIVPGAISRRYPTLGALNPFSTWRDKRRIVQQLQPYLDRLPEHVRRNTTMGMDVARTPEGFRLIETNIGGQSGFLSPDKIQSPTLAPHAFYKAVTGRESAPLAAAKALGAGGLAAGGVGLAQRATD